MKYSSVKMVNSDKSATKLMRKGWELINTFHYGNVIAYILVEPSEEVSEELNDMEIEQVEETACELEKHLSDGENC